jgi:hypothetical protein
MNNKISDTSLIYIANLKLYIFFSLQLEIFIYILLFIKF